ncbi:hypothetical protein JCM9957A_14530 [Kineosporia succinea]|uniref:O-antigen ligase n=1 Tax=Kineosporia succinea TaxID=84632 RepID=A0ABT9NX55_9ACTN|nr:hypothetical protein [Kineosporia succinea]MDP9825004.1 hypothetical protein [Kineosporia succinea]
MFSPPAPDKGRGDTSADYILRWTLVGSALAGLPNLTGWNVLPMTFVLNGGIALSMMVGFFGPRTPSIARATWLLFAGGYLTVKLTALALGSHPAGPDDLLQAYKAYIFLVPLVWFIGRKCFTPAGLARTVRQILAVTALKYLIVFAATAGTHRPGVWTENNFELMLVIGLTYLAWPHLGRNRGWWMTLLCLIVLIGESRSGVIELALVFVVIFWRPRDPRFLLYVAGGGIVVWLSNYVFSQRSNGSPSDRWQFWQIFRAESAAWNLNDWLVGRPPLTPLSLESCDRLAPWGGLRAMNATDICYSVGLHMFSLRVLMDQGVLGALFLLLFIWLALRASGAGMRDRVALLGIGLANSMSVSAFNSEYLLIPLLVAAGLRYRAHPSPTAPPVPVERVSG